MVTGDWKSQWAAGAKESRQFGNAAKREGFLKSPEQRSFPVFPAILPFYFNLELKLQSSSPPVSPPLRVTWKCETNSCCKERGNFTWMSNSCNLLGSSEQLGFLLLHSLLSSPLSSSFRSRELSEDKQHYETGGCPTPPAPANVAVPRWFIAASEQCRYR